MVSLLLEPPEPASGPRHTNPTAVQRQQGRSGYTLRRPHDIHGHHCAETGCRSEGFTFWREDSHGGIRGNAGRCVGMTCVHKPPPPQPHLQPLTSIWLSLPVCLLPSIQRPGESLLCARRFSRKYCNKQNSKIHAFMFRFGKRKRQNK